MQFHEHDSYRKELAGICKKQKQLARAVNDGMAKVAKLLAIQFDPINPEVAVPPGKLHRVSGFETWELCGRLKLCCLGQSSDQTNGRACGLPSAVTK